MRTRRLLVTGVCATLGLGLVLVSLWLLMGEPAHAQAGAQAGLDLPAAANAPAFPPVVYTVCPAGPPDCDYALIQSAVDAADDGDVIKVAGAVYTGVNTYGGKPQVVYLTKTLTIRGGYTTTNWAVPNPRANPTTLDAQLQGRVVFIVGDIQPTIELLNITGGRANGLGGSAGGGDAGGGIYVRDAAPVIVDLQVLTNTAAYGAGIYLRDSDATVRRNSLRGNTASQRGGGLAVEGGEPLIEQNTVSGNQATNFGGGIHVSSSSATVVRNLIVDNNSLNGGGLHIAGSPAQVNANTLLGNSATSGGGVYLDGSQPRLTNNLIAENTATTNASAIRVLNGSPRLLHNTIARNAGGNGTGIYVRDYLGGPSHLYMTNTILVSHTIGLRVDSDTTASLDATLWGSGIWANGTDWTGLGTIYTGSLNLWQEPAFWDVALGGYHISKSSPAVDVGLASDVDSDIDGEPRPIGDYSDLGADEHSTGCYARVNDSLIYPILQVAVDLAHEGDTIKVAGRCLGVRMHAGLSQTVYISRNITLRGGYTLTNWTVADPGLYPTTLDAQGEGRVMVVAGPVSPTIEGFRITGGDASAQGGLGGGVCVLTATATIRQNEISSNTATTGGGVYLQASAARVLSNALDLNTAEYGAGLALKSSPATLRANTVANNTASWGGGGLYLVGSAAQVLENEIDGNHADWGGGGLYLTASDANLRGNTISDNTAALNGGGLYLHNSGATLWANQVQDNQADSAGGGIYLAQDDSVLDRNTITGNTAPRGGGLVVAENSQSLLSNTLFQSNVANRGGGGYLRGDPTLVNTILVGNRANSLGSGLWIESASPRLLHSTLSGNTGGQRIGVYVSQRSGGGASGAVLTNTILVGHNIGISVTSGNSATLNGVLWHNSPITAAGGVTATVIVENQTVGDPLFAADGYHLLGLSPAMDNGVAAGVALDIDGEARDDVPDLGADEKRCWVRLNDGSTEYLTVQAAVDASISPADVVKVAGYCSGVSMRSGVTQTVYLNHPLTIQGGYAPPNWSAPDPQAHPTTLDALGQGRVLYVAGDFAATLTGLRITGGDAAGLGGGTGGADAGGGVYVTTAAIVIRDNWVLSNTADSGGGLWLVNSPAQITGNLVSSNTALRGGGIGLSGSTATLSANLIRGNQADQHGGGLELDGSDASLVNNVIVENQAGLAGGGMASWGGSPRLWHTTLADNSGSSGIEVRWHQPAGVYGTVALTNTVLASHTVAISVGTGNTATLNGVLWHGNPITVAATGTATVWVQNQLTGDPARAADGFHLGDNSAAIDEGVSAGVLVDVEGDVRPQGLGYDLGADEWRCTPLAGLQIEHPTRLVVDLPYTFTAVVSPPNATLPISFTWAPEPGTGQGTAQAGYTFATTGTHTLDLSAFNCAGPVAVSKTMVVVLPDQAGVIVDPDLGATLIYTDDRGLTTTVTVPPWAVTSTIVLVYTLVDTVTAPSGLVWAQHAFYLDAYRDGVLLPGFIFERPITISIAYTDTDVAGLDENTLALRYKLGLQWLTDGITLAHLDPSQNVVASGVAHLSKFALFANEPNEPPDVPTSPVPEDGAVAVPLTQTLSWQGSDPDADPLTYAVFLGDSDPPPLVATQVTTTSLSPGLLAPHTTYYWAITVTDGISSTDGPVWQFTTLNRAPLVPVAVAPVNGAGGVSPGHDLSWRGGDPDDDALTYTVALGTSDPPPIIATVATTSYDPGPLMPEMAYYWAITASDGISVTGGPVWHFTTALFDGSMTKSVTPLGQVRYGQEITYTLVVSAAPGSQVGLYDPLSGTTFSRFVVQPAGVIQVGDVITGTVTLAATSQVTIQLVALVAVPLVPGNVVQVTNRACVYPINGDVGDCVWSDLVSNPAIRLYQVYLPVILR